MSDPGESEDDDDSAEFEHVLMFLPGLFPADRLFTAAVPADAETAR